MAAQDVWESGNLGKLPYRIGMWAPLAPRHEGLGMTFAQPWLTDYCGPSLPLVDEIPKMRILVIDDDADLQRVISQYLEPDGYIVLGAQDAREGLDLILSWHPDLVLLDIVMPDMDGRQLCEKARRVSQVPIVFLTGLGNEMDIVSALNAGADDYLLKPPRGDELRARVRALLRQDPSSVHTRSYYDDGYLVIDLAAQRVQKQGLRVDLSPLAFRLLSCLVARRGQLVPYQELMEAIWGTTQGKSTAMLHLYLRHLRSKLEPDPHQPRYLLNRFREGYWFAPHDFPEFCSKSNPHHDHPMAGKPH